MTEDMGRQNPGESLKKEELSESELRAKIENQSKKVDILKKIKIYLTSFKWQAILFIFISIIFPLIITSFFILIISEGVNLEVFSGTPFEMLINNTNYTLLIIRDFWADYIIIFNFGFLTMLIGLDPINMTTSFGGDNKAIITTTVFHSFLTILIFNIISIFTMNFFKIGKEGTNKISELTKKLRETYAKAHTMKSTKEKEIEEGKLKKIKKEIVKRVKELTMSQRTDPKKIYFQSTPAFKIMVDKIDSPGAGSLAGVTNEYWQKKLAKSQMIDSWEECLDFLFKWQFNANQLGYIEKLNIINNVETGIDKVKFCNYRTYSLNQYSFEEQKENCMKIMCIAAYYKNYPKHVFLNFFESFDIVFDKNEIKLIVNASNWIMAIEKDKKVNILPMALLLPKMKCLKKTYEISKLVYDTLGDLTAMMPLLQNQAIEHKGFEQNSPFTKTYLNVENIIILKTIDFIEILFFNMFISFNQTREIPKPGGKKEIRPIWNKELVALMEKIQEQKSLDPEVKEEITEIIKKKLRNKIKGIKQDNQTQQFTEAIDAEIQVAKLKRFLSIDMFVDLYKDFIKNTVYKTYFKDVKEYEIELSKESKDLITDISNNLLKQIKPYYEYYYDRLDIYDNIRMIEKD